ncbi:DUF4189 domain-containing protein [Pseudanabaena yagii]|uniref:DUF4189 domain-containing protein n=1 Tax=Pseudanabaena yagii GIHE-NHR1 TaxID=2722753 RepID=A0ABX1LP56_9CYAN|nr:DUF4189 domain-containing protein [Pseudanabaena yagii]NMF57091.1 DUF4189 domain-containing protein [Pseudanabaena yagii GIHE-NHR1]
MKKYLGFIAATFLLVEGFGIGAAIAGSQYGAVATGPNGAYGWAYNFDSAEGAKQYALSACEGSCTEVVTFSNGCAAVAKGGGYFGWAAATDETTAKNNALGYCGNDSCAIQVWACTDH